MPVYASVGDPATKRINQFISVVAGKCPDEIEGDFDRYGIKGDVVDALVYLTHVIAEKPGRYVIDIGCLLIGAFRGVSSNTEVMVGRRDLSTRSREELVRIARSARGMWADREDLGDAVEYVNRLRASWERRAGDLRIG